MATVDEAFEEILAATPKVVTFEKRMVLADGVAVGEIIGHRMNHPRFGATSDIRIKRLSDGHVFGTWAYMADAKKDAEYMARTGELS